MTRRRVLAAAALAFTCVAAQDAAPPEPDAASAAAIKGADAYLLRSVRAVGERIGGIVRVERPPDLVAVRADEATRTAEALARALLLLPSANASARGRAWRDLGFGSVRDPQDLLAALERDVPGMTFDAARARLLVDPQRLLPSAGQGDPDEDADASILLATGVAPDEPVAGHYVAHVLLDAPPLEGPVTTDAILARSSLSEGAANLAALVLLFGGVGLESEVLAGSVRPEDALGGRLMPDALRSASPVVANLLEFVYLDGFAQAASLVRKGGFSRLAQERRSRRTTRDVMHLDRPPASPVEIPPPRLPASLVGPFADRDSLGEHGIVALVSLLTGKDNLGLIAGDGWAADALWRYETVPGPTADGADGVTVWVTRWASGEDAKDFVYSLERCLQARFPGEPLTDDPQRGGRVLGRADRVYRIERNDLQVTMTIAPPVIDAKLGPEPKKKEPARPPKPAKR